MLSASGPIQNAFMGSIALGRQLITSLLFWPPLKPPSLRHCPKQPLITVINSRVRCVRDRLLFITSSIVTYSYRGRNSVAHPLYPHLPLSLLRYLKGLHGPANRGRLNSNAHPRSKVCLLQIHIYDLCLLHLFIFRSHTCIEFFSQT